MDQIPLLHTDIFSGQPATVIQYSKEKNAAGIDAHTEN